MRGSLRRTSRRRGVAMLLAIFASIVVFVMVIAFAAASSLSPRISGNIRNRARARSIAESGLQMAAAYVVSNNTWRTDKTPGTWVSNQALDGGTFTVTAQAGEDTNGDGIVEGPGNFTSDPTTPVTLTVTAQLNGAKWTSQEVLKQATMAAGVYAASSVSVTGGTIDSFDSSVGPYGGANISSKARLCTEATADRSISVTNGSQVKGDAYVGTDADPWRAIYVDSSSSVSGVESATVQPAPMPALQAPSNLGPSVGNTSYQGNKTWTVDTNLHCNNLTVKSNNYLKISGHVTIYAEGDVNLWNKTGIEILPNSSLELYVGGAVKMYSHAPAVTVDGPGLSRMKIFVLGTGPVSIPDSTTMEGVIMAPQSDVTLDSGSSLLGAVIAKSVKIQGGASIHEDKNITGASPHDAVTLSGYSFRWVR